MSDRYCIFSPTAGNYRRGCERLIALGITAEPKVVRGIEIGSIALNGGDHTNAPPTSALSGKADIQLLPRMRVIGGN